MGFENRDYYREPEWNRGGGGEHPVCRWIIGLCVVVFLGQMIPSLEVERWLALSKAEVMQGQVWRLVTYAFCHDTKNLLHIVFNTLCLWWFGRAIEERQGSREFLAFYLVAAVFSGLAHIALEAVFNQSSIAVGASGSLMAVMSIFAMLYPRQQVMFFGLIPIEIRWLIVGFIAFDTIPIWAALSGRQTNDGIAHGAHLGGLLFGFLYHIFELRLTNWVSFGGLRSWWSDRRRRQSMRLYTPDPESLDEDDLEKSMDEVLRKITEQGEASLTPQERKILSEASRRIRERTRS